MSRGSNFYFTNAFYTTSTKRASPITNIRISLYLKSSSQAKDLGTRSPWGETETSPGASGGNGSNGSLDDDDGSEDPEDF